MEIGSYLGLVNEHYPGLIPTDLQEISINTDGWGSLVLDIAGAYIFRFPRRPEIVAGYAKEAALLPELSSALPVSVPVFAYACLNDPDYRRCFVGYRKIHGDPWSSQLARAHQLNQHLAEFLTRLHQIPLEQAGRLIGLQFDPLGWRREYLDFYSWIQENIFPLLEAPARLKTTRLWKSFLDDEDLFRFQPALIHADLCADHILCDPARCQVNGIIDWEDATLGDPALDFVGLLYLGGWETVEEILSAYGGIVDEAFCQRMAFYHVAIPFHQIRFGLETKDDAQVRDGINTLYRLL